MKRLLFSLVLSVTLAFGAFAAPVGPTEPEPAEAYYFCYSEGWNTYCYYCTDWCQPDWVCWSGYWGWANLWWYYWTQVWHYGWDDYAFWNWFWQWWWPCGAHGIY